MSSAGTATITFQSDVQQVYAAWSQFQQYVKANPIPIGPAGIGLTAQQLQAPFQQALGAAARNAAKEFIGELQGGGGSGGGGGRGGSLGISTSGLARYLGIGFIAREVLRIGQDYERYQIMASTASSPLERYRAEQHLQRSLFSIPIAGQVAELATFSQRAPAEIMFAQVQRQEQNNELLQRSMEAQRALFRQASAAGLGPPESVGRQMAEAENADARRRDDIRKDQTERVKAAQATKEAAIAEAEAAKYRAAGPVDSARARWGDRAVRAKDDAEYNFKVQKDAITADTNRRLAQADVLRKADEDEIRYRHRQAEVRTRQEAEVARLEYEHKPQVAEARSIYNRFEREVETFRHAGDTGAATNVLTEARYRLMHERERLQLGGSAEETENPAALDYSGTNQTFMGRGRGGYDDTAEAIKEYGEKLDAILTELRGINKGVN